MVNQMLTKRVLPVVLAATAIGWLDYKLGHPSDKVIDAGLKTNVLRADLTDTLPGGRAVTDFYENTVPGPQYGPLALPAAGAFAGALIHYGRVLGGKFPTEAARKADSLILPEMKALREWAGSGKKLASIEGLAQIWKGLGTPGKGAAIGLAMALPFIPGMLGSRKTGGELRDIYSGQEQVPVRSGLWWELGSTPFEGARIKAWRPHWSILHKARAEDAALYGSEEEKWKHNPILHPLRWLKDPYYLEKQHYEDQPSFPPICRLCKALLTGSHILDYAHIYELLAVGMLRPGLIPVPAPARSASRIPKLRHLLLDGPNTAPPELWLVPCLSGLVVRCVFLEGSEGNIPVSISGKGHWRGWYRLC